MSIKSREPSRREAIAIMAAGVWALGANGASAQATGSNPQGSGPRVFVTGSSGGLGLAAAQRLIALGHRVVVHGRDRKRADAALKATPGAEAAVFGDVSVMAQTRQVAEQVNAIGPCYAVIHNVGIGGRSDGAKTADGLPPIFAVNTLAPYMLTALIKRPERLVYVSSQVHRGISLDRNDLTFARRPWNGRQAYAESKLQDALLAFAAARLWPGVFSNAMHPGWVPTEMGGPSATGSLAKGADTEAWLAASDDPAAKVTGQFFYDKDVEKPNPEARDVDLQNLLLTECARISGVEFPA